MRLRSKYFIVFWICMLLVWPLGGCKKEKLNLGSVTDGVYRNGFFSIEMPVPDDWKEFPEETLNGIMMANAGYSSDSSGENILPEYKELDMLALFGMQDQKELASSITVIAEKRRNADRFISVQKYLEVTREQLKGINDQYVFSDIKTMVIDETEFTYMEATMADDNMKIKQTLFVRDMKDYYLILTTTAYDDSAFERIGEIMKEVRCR